MRNKKNFLFHCYFWFLEDDPFIAPLKECGRGGRGETIRRSQKKKRGNTGDPDSIAEPKKNSESSIYIIRYSVNRL